MITINFLDYSKDIDRVNQFYLSCYGRERTRAEFDWEFKNCPLGPSVYVLALDKGEVVGTVAAIPYQFLAGDRTIMTAKVEDLLIADRYRGSKTYTLMMDALEKECQLRGIVILWAFTYATKSFLRQGFSVPLRANVGLYVVNPIQGFSLIRAFGGADALVKAGFSIVAWLWSITSKFYPAGLLKDYQCKEQQVSDLNQLLNDTRHVFLSQDNSFLKWRIYENPHLISVRTFCLVNKQGGMEGCVIANIDSFGTGHIIQVALDDSLTFTTAQAFVRWAIKEMVKKCALIRYWGFDFNSFHHGDHKLMRRCGFLFTNRGIPFVWKATDEATTPLRLKLSRMASQGTV